MNLKNLDKYLNAFHKKFSISGNVLAAIGDDIIYNKCLGYANIEHNVRNRLYTKFIIGSMAKQFTAFAILILESQGKLKLDDKLDKYLPDFPLANQININHLLTHTSGMFEYTALPAYEKKELRHRTFGQVLKYLQRMSHLNPPGKELRYNCSGYLVLGRIIELVSEESYENFLKKHIFYELGMNNSGLYHNEQLIPHMAKRYEIINKTIMHAPPENAVWLYSSGGIYSTINDLLSWNNHLISDIPLIGKRNLAIMFKTSHGDYKYGMSRFKQFGRDIFGHGGKVCGFQSDQRVSKKDKLIVLALYNRTKSYIGIAPRCFTMMGILLGSLDVSLRSPRKIPLTPTIKRLLPGTYYDFQVLPVKFRLQIENEDLILSYIHPYYQCQMKERYYLTPDNLFQSYSDIESVPFHIATDNQNITFGGIQKVESIKKGKIS